MSCKSVFGLIFLGIIQGILNPAKADYLATTKVGSESTHRDDIWYFGWSLPEFWPMDCCCPRLKDISNYVFPLKSASGGWSRQSPQHS